MNSQELIELTKDLIYHATHFDLPYIKESYADKLIIANVDEKGNANTMNKEQLVAFAEQNKASNIAPFSTKTEFHYSVCDDKQGMVVITRELELSGKLSRRFLTIIWEYLSGRWQI